MVGEKFLVKKMLKCGVGDKFLKSIIGVSMEDFEEEMEGILHQWEYELMDANGKIDEDFDLC